MARLAKPKICVRSGVVVVSSTPARDAQSLKRSAAYQQRGVEARAKAEHIMRENEATLRRMQHPGSKKYASQTAYDYCVFMLAHSGVAGCRKTVKMLELLLSAKDHGVDWRPEFVVAEDEYAV